MCSDCGRRPANTSRWRRVWMRIVELYNAALQERRDGWSHQQDADQVWGSVGAADRDTEGTPGSGGVVVLQSAGHVAPARIRPSPGSSGG